MNKYVTEYTLNGIRYMGEYITAPSWELAEQYCRDKMPHLTITGCLVSEISTLEDGITPDFSTMIDYDNLN